MGGFVPVGYVKHDRRLVVDEAEAETIRLIFRRYHELTSVRLLKQDLDRRGLVSKIRTGKNGLQMGGKAYSRDKLYKLLSNPIYVGEIKHLTKRIRLPIDWSDQKRLLNITNQSVV
jgi:site-specific DNA recombinase